MRKSWIGGLIDEVEIVEGDSESSAEICLLLDPIYGGVTSIYIINGTDKERQQAVSMLRALGREIASFDAIIRYVAEIEIPVRAKNGKKEKTKEVCTVHES